jgi:hypothetical protein
MRSGVLGRDTASPPPSDPNNNPQNVAAVYQGPLEPLGISVTWDDPVNGPPDSYTVKRTVGVSTVTLSASAASPYLDGSFDSVAGQSAVFTVEAVYPSATGSASAAAVTMPPATAGTVTNTGQTSDSVSFSVARPTGSTITDALLFNAIPADISDGTELAFVNGAGSPLTGTFSGLSPGTYYMGCHATNATGYGHGGPYTEVVIE